MGYVDTACRHVLLRQGVLGIKVKIMLPWDPQGKCGPKKPLPDHVSIVEPKESFATQPILRPKCRSPMPLLFRNRSRDIIFDSKLLSSMSGVDKKMSDL